MAARQISLAACLTLGGGLAAQHARAAAAQLVQIQAGPGRAALPAAPRLGNLGPYGSPSPLWRAVKPADLPGLPERYRGADLSAAYNLLELGGFGPERFLSLEPPARQELLAEALRRAETRIRSDADMLIGQVPGADPAQAEFPFYVGLLSMMKGRLAPYLESPEQAEAAAQAYTAAHPRLSQAESERFKSALERVALSMTRGPSEGLTLAESVAAGMANVPAYLITPKVARLRQALRPVPGRRPEPPEPSLGRRLSMSAKVLALSARHRIKRAVSEKLYVPARTFFRWFMGHAGEIIRHYVTGREMDSHSWRWHVVENLHREGDFRGSFGHPVHDGSLEVMSRLVFPASARARIMSQTREVGRDIVVAGEIIPVKRLQLSAMAGISGMSFPQLSAQSHLSLLYIHLMLAKEGVRALFNTGEGGPGLHLALLEGDKEKAKAQLRAWNFEHGQFKEGSWDEAKVVHFVDELMAKRDQVLAEFTAEDLSKAQIAIQFGSALNGIRGPDSRVDLDKLRAAAASPYVAMVQYKLKQAAKRGAKVDPRKVDAVVAAWREIPRDQPFKSPEINPEFDSYENIAALLLATKIATGKPVSLKFGVGDVADARDFLEFLRDAGALPDHIQLDGRGDDFSPGSGNAPPGANTSLPASEAVLVIDAILKTLGARDQVFLEATGDVLLPIDGVEKLALGADGVSGARLWMGMGLGCAMVRSCANGNCPYGIASRGDTLVGLSLDPARVGPKGLAAASNWRKTFAQILAEAGSEDWRTFRATHGLAAASNVLRVKRGLQTLTLDQIYSLDYASNLLRGVMGRDEVARLVFGRPGS